MVAAAVAEVIKKDRQHGSIFSTGLTVEQCPELQAQTASTRRKKHLM